MKKYIKQPRQVLPGTPLQIPGYDRPHKLCVYCGFHRDIADFSSPGTLKCQSCKRIYSAAWVDKNRERANQSARRHRKNNPESCRNSRLKLRYGITAQDYDAFMEAQGGVCAICGKACALYGRLSVDHDHITKKIRGLLCNKCNVAIGALGESPAILRSAADYIEGME